LQSAPRVGRKKAEQLILDLADKLDDLGEGLGVEGRSVQRPEGPGADDAIRALVSLGYSTIDSERRVREVLEEDGKGLPAADLIRKALAKVTR
jgi:Holliday junction DNA helicase RuvA